MFHGICTSQMQQVAPLKLRYRASLACALVAIALIAYDTPTAHAELDPPVSVQLIADPNDVPIPGEEFSAQLRFESSEPLSVKYLRLLGNWEALDIGLGWGDSMVLDPGVPQEVGFTVAGGDVTDPVGVEFSAWGRKVYWDFFLVPPHYELNKDGSASVRQVTEPLDLVLLESAQTMALPGPDPTGPPGWKSDADDRNAEDQKVDGVTQKGYHIRVRGQFVYWRPDNLPLGVDGMTVQVWDEDDNPDDLIGLGGTDVNGFYDFTFWYDQSERPDVYVRFLASNTEVGCIWVGSDYNRYAWRTHVLDDFEGTYLDYGTMTSGDPWKYAVLNLLTNTTRAWRWSFHQGHDPPFVWLAVPMTQHAFYNRQDGLIKIGNPVFFWEELVVCHEYGHHWMATLSNYISYSGQYCNGVCDPSPDECLHCLYGEESGDVAYKEGWPNWFAASVVERFYPDYGHLPWVYPQIDNHEAGAAGVDPFITEGNFGGLLFDIYDSDYDEDDVFPDGKDMLFLGAGEIMAIPRQVVPLTVVDFINSFMARNPGILPEFWSTAMNSGYQLDHTDPGVVTNLTSPSHDGVPSSSDGTVDYVWTAAPDDMSGIGGYAISLSEGVIQAPGHTPSLLGEHTSFTCAQLDVGDWYFSIRAIDKAGNSGGYVFYGPTTIREPYPPDLTHFTPLGWDYAIVPRNDNAASFGNVHVPLGLDHGTWNYYNLSVVNVGELPTNSRWDIAFQVDGVHLTTESIIPPSSLGVGSGRSWYNQGPIYMDGGRHNFSMWIDYPEANAEMNENNNFWWRQYVWNPKTAPLDTPYRTNMPPNPTGGVRWVFPPFSGSCDGYRISTGPPTYIGALLKAEEMDDDYDLQIFTPSSGSDHGFDVDTRQAFGTRAAGLVDAVIVRPGNVAPSVFDIGVFNWARDDGYYEILGIESTAMAFDTEVSIALAEDEYLQMRHFDVPVEGVGWVSIELNTAPAAGPIHVAPLHFEHTYGGLTDLAPEVVTDTGGFAVLEFEVTEESRNGLVIWRDPSEIPVPKADADGPTPTKAAPAVSMNVKAYPTPADYQPWALRGWYKPLVPRPVPDADPQYVPEPDYLLGDLPQTFINLCTMNRGPNGDPEVANRIYLDGEILSEQVWGNYWGGQARMVIEYTGRTVRGGRHTLATHIDYDELLEETDDINNMFAKQWVWQPPTIALNSPVARAAPPEPQAGWDALAMLSEELIANCDGIRLPMPARSGDDGHWLGLATMPGAGSDVDVRLHDETWKAEQGFDEIRSHSAWPVGESDFVMTNFRMCTPRVMDVGVVKGSGSEDYTAEAVASVYLDTNPVGTYSGFGIEPGHILDLHEVYLDEGLLAVRLHNYTNDADLGITLHPGNVPYLFKALWVEDGSSWKMGGGHDEWIIVNLPFSGYYAVAVWKAVHEDLPEDAPYELVFYRDLTGVPGHDPLPVRTAIASIHPNPFNPRTAIDYELATQGPVRMEVYNLRGELVRRLLTGVVKPAGRYTQIWNGTDDSGRTLASGVYVIRMEAAGIGDRKKAVLVR